MTHDVPAERLRTPDPLLDARESRLVGFTHGWGG
jgi:hypothetical protein